MIIDGYLVKDAKRKFNKVVFLKCGFALAMIAIPVLLGIFVGILASVVAIMSALLINLIRLALLPVPTFETKIKNQYRYTELLWPTKNREIVYSLNTLINDYVEELKLFCSPSELFDETFNFLKAAEKSDKLVAEADQRCKKMYWLVDACKVERRRAEEERLALLPVTSDVLDTALQIAEEKK